MINVLIVDDQKIARTMMEAVVLENADRYNLAASIDDCALAQMYCADKNINLLLMDVYTQDKQCGISCAKNIKQLYPHIKIIIVTSLPEHTFIEKAKNAGCDSFWYKDYYDIPLIEVMDRTARGESCYPQSTPTIQIGNAKSTNFTKQELKLLRYKVNGYSNIEICEMLNIKKRTIDVHISNLKAKTGYESILRLVSDISTKRFIIPDLFIDT